MENEQTTRREIIDQRLAAAGWDVSDPTQVIQEFFIRSQPAHADQSVSLHEPRADFQVPQLTLVRDYSDALAKSIPFLRNEIAHGTTMLLDQGAFHTRICAELINQLFPPPPDTAIPSAP